MTDDETKPDPPADDVLLLPAWVMAAIRSELLADPDDEEPGD